MFINPNLEVSCCFVNVCLATNTLAFVNDVSFLETFIFLKRIIKFVPLTKATRGISLTWPRGTEKNPLSSFWLRWRGHPFTIGPLGMFETLWNNLTPSLFRRCLWKKIPTSQVLMDLIHRGAQIINGMYRERKLMTSVMTSYMRAE